MEARVQQLEKSMQEIQAQLEFVGQMAVGRTEILEIINQKIGSRVIEAVTASHAKKKEAWEYVNVKDASRHLLNQFGATGETSFREFKHEVKV